MRMLAVYHKGPSLAFISHLDVQRTLQRAMRRAGIPLAFSQGFNPHPKLSFASALATGQTSDAEWFEAELSEDVAPEEFLARVNGMLPRDFYFSDAMAAPDKLPSLSSLTRAGAYVIQFYLDREIPEDLLISKLEAMLSGEIIVNKKTKSGYRDVDLRPEIIEAFVERVEGSCVTLRVLGRLQADGGLRADLFTRAFLDRLDAQGDVRIHRNAMYFAADGLLPELPSE